MIGRYKGFVARIKEEVPNLFATHCVIHRRHLYAKNLSERLSDSLSLVVRVINKIKICVLNTRLFRQLCDKIDEKFKSLLLHTEVCWPPKESRLKRFFSLYDTIVKFLLSNREDDRAKDIDYIRRGVNLNTFVWLKYKACSDNCVTKLSEKFKSLLLSHRGLLASKRVTSQKIF